MTAGREGAAGAALSALTVLVLAGQVYGRAPAWRKDESSLLSSDTLLFQDLYLHLVSGGSAEGWVTTPAPLWHSDALLTFLTMAATGGDLLLSTALMAAVICLLLTWSLASLVRRASGFAAGRSWLHAAAAVAALVALVSVSGSWTGTFGSTHRAFNAVLFFLASSGLAAVLAAGRANRPLTWCYLAACPLLGMSDGLLLFHVALPVLATAVLWRVTAGSGRDAGLIVAAAALGAALCLGGYLSSTFVQTEVLSFRANVTPASMVAASVFGKSGLAGGDVSVPAALDTAVRSVANLHDFIVDEMSGRNLLNALLVLSVAPLLAWARLAGVRASARRDPGDPEACARFVAVAMVCMMMLLCLVVVTLVQPNVRYAWVAMWAPFLTLAVAVARFDLASEGEGADAGWLVRPASRSAIWLAVLVLAADLSFFRPAAETSERLACSREALGGTGLERGMVPYWNAREVSLFSGDGIDHLVYILHGEIPSEESASASRDDQPFFPSPRQSPRIYPHNGSVRHTEGDADYIVFGTDRTDGLAIFEHGFGVPGRVVRCRQEVYMLYSKGRIDSGILLTWS